MMRSSPRVTSVLLHVALAVLCLHDVQSASKVLTLTQSNFYGTVKGPPKKWFVKFYAEWCGHCKRLRPVWDELSESVDDSIGIAKVDATKNRDLADQFSVRGYPTLIYIHDDNSFYRYSGGRTLEDFQAFLSGGYSEMAPSPMPSPPGWNDVLASYQKRLQKEYDMLEEDFQHIMAVRKNAMAAFLIIGGTVGFILGCAMSVFCCRSSKSKGKEKND